VKFALVNPPWSFEGSIYFGCRAPHLPLEFGYARALLERAGHEVILVDAQLHDLDDEQVARRVAAFAPDRIVITTAPSYLFWRCAPPELRVPARTLRVLRAHLAPLPPRSSPGRTGPALGRPEIVAVGPHASTTPRAALGKLAADVAVLGECEEILPRLAKPREAWTDVPSIAYVDSTGTFRLQGSPHASDMGALPALTWPAEDVRAHAHHHHRFDAEPAGAGAEMEVSRGCPYHCSFCAKDNFRSDYRRRATETILEELDALLAQGVRYVYFIDEIFLPNKPLLEAFAERRFAFGIQTRIDLWSHDLIELLGRAGCVSIEAGVESITVEGRNLLDKGSRLTTAQLAERLIYARGHVPFVQANLLASGSDDPVDVAAWRTHLRKFGVWANEPVPMFPYPGSPDYTRRWGAPDDQAWERAMDHYLSTFTAFSDIQDARPRPLAELEHADAG
jgi:anaerobic magnesium-protoporphyrin IX monomethyl ester cyclase